MGQSGYRKHFLSLNGGSIIFWKYRSNLTEFEHFRINFEPYNMTMPKHKPLCPAFVLRDVTCSRMKSYKCKTKVFIRQWWCVLAFANKIDQPEFVKSCRVTFKKIHHINRFPISCKICLQTFPWLFGCQSWSFCRSHRKVLLKSSFSCRH